MNVYVPLAKQSKKARKAHNALKRGSWNGVNPVTRTTPDKKTYDRNRAKQEAHRLREER